MVLEVAGGTGRAGDLLNSYRKRKVQAVATRARMNPEKRVAIWTPAPFVLAARTNSCGAGKKRGPVLELSLHRSLDAAIQIIQFGQRL
jgi:hypothetical protein